MKSESNYPMGNRDSVLGPNSCLNITLWLDSFCKCKECVAVLTMLYKKSGAVSCAGSDFLCVLALYNTNPWPIVVLTTLAMVYSKVMR